MKKRSAIMLYLSLSQISLLILSIFSFAFIIYQINFVSSQDYSVEGLVKKTDKNSATLGGAKSTSILTGQGTFIEGSYITNLQTEENILLKDISGITETSEGTIQIIGEKGDVLGTVSKENAAAFKSNLQAKGIGITEKETFSIFGKQITGGAAHLVQGLFWGLAVAGAIKLLGDLFGVDKGVTGALSIGAFAGIMTWQGLQSLGPSGFDVLSGSNFLVGSSGLIGIAVGLTVFALTYKKETKKIVDFQCLPWEPPLGGNDCELCNSDSFRPCTEYRCKSLGQACDLVNKGTIEESCVWVARNDVTPPTITPSQEALTLNHRYTSHDTLPPSLGTKIVRTPGDTCIKAFTPLEFGVTLNEPGQCRIDYTHTENFDDMVFFFGESNLYRYNHTQKLSLPSPASLEAASPEIQSDGIYDLFVRCRDANGNTNVQEFSFNFCVDPSPDTTPPIVVSTSILSGSPVSFDSDEVEVDFYINEPAECKWSIQDKNFNDMENQMSCSTEVHQVNAQQLYPCTTVLTGVENNKENTFYARCKDQPWLQNNESERNVNTQSYIYKLLGSRPLNILSAKPENETITGSTNTVPVNLEVETANGAEEGKAICYFSPTGEEGSYVTMFETGSHMHKQTLSLVAGDYNYYFRCVDAGGNSDEINISFNVFVDRDPPIVTRIYKEGPDAIKIVTNEDAACVYSLNSCNYNFDEGIKALKVPGKENINFIEWKPNIIYYIKCRDKFNNEPNPNECSIAVSATNIG